MSLGLPARVEDKIQTEPNSGCWLWMGAINADGYGTMRLSNPRRNALAHRGIYAMACAPIPEGLELDHTCRVRCCVNPEHLEPVTHAVNVARGDCGKAGAAFQRNKTHCPAGHLYDARNTQHRPNKGRRCRTCAMLFTRRYRAKRKS